METIFFLTLFVLLVYPFISLELIRRNKSNPILRRKILIIVITSAAIIVLSMVLHISTTSELVDWIFASVIYLALCILIWEAIYSRNTLLKGVGVLISVVIFGLSLSLCTIGILGLGLILGEVLPEHRISFPEGVIVKQYNNGNAISDFRATTIEVSQTIPWLPLIEWRKMEKTYESLMLKDHIHADFDAAKQILTLKGLEIVPGTKQDKQWHDVVIL